VELADTNSNSGFGRPLSEVVSRYLEAIYYIAHEGEEVRSARLANWLGVSRPTVTVALRRMTRDGLVRINGSRGISLTPVGERAAAGIVRRHRIVERWLSDALGLDWVQADEEAARLEHAVSDLVEARLYEAIGQPQTCPHGNPIPGHSEVAADEERLSIQADGARVRITRISEVAEREAPPLLGYLLQKRITPGRLLEVRELDVVGRAVRVWDGEREVTLSEDIASKVWVVPAGNLQTGLEASN
jgi:DtxR family Mn-dependent transcriptional regulator